MEELARARRIRDLGDPNSSYYRGADALLSGLRKAMNAEKKKKSNGGVVKVPYQLVGEDIRRLSAEFGCEISVNPRKSATQPFAYAKMYVAAEMNARIKAWSGEEVIMVDGDLGDIVARMQSWVHVCRTHSTSDIAASEVMQAAALTRMCEAEKTNLRAEAASVLHQIEVGGGRNVCLSARNCRVSCDTILFELHKTNMNPRQAAAVMVAHEAVRVKTWFFFESAMLTEDEGELTSMRGCFVVDRKRDLVSIIPEGAREPCAVYTYSVLREYVATSNVVYDGKSCTVEVHDNVPGIFFVIVADAGEVRDFDCGLDRRIFHPAGTAMVTVTQKMFFSTVTSGTSGVHDVTIRVPKTMWDRVYARMMSVADDAHGMDTARVAVFDVASQEVTMGTFVRVPRGLPYDVPEVFARAVCKLTAMERVNMLVESQSARNYVNLLQRGNLQFVAGCVAKLMVGGIATFADALLKLPTVIGLNGSYEDYSVKVDRGVDSTLIMGTTSSGYQGFVPYLPGGEHASCAAYSDAGSVRREVIRTAMEYSRAVDDYTIALSGSGKSCTTEHTFVSCQSSVGKELDGDKQRLADKLNYVSGADGVRSVVRVKEEYEVISEPELSVEMHVGDAVGIIADVVSEQLPSVGGLSVEARQYLAADADKFAAYEVPLLKLNHAKITEPRVQRVRRSVLGTACEGKRVPTQANGVSAFSGRVANAPNMAGAIDIESRLKTDFAAFESVCLRDGWRDRLREACDQGLWELDTAEISKYVAKMSSSNVAKAISEDFSVGNIDLTKWIGMVKAMPKAKCTEEASGKIVVPQTIVYQDSKMTNSLFSAQTSKVLDFVDQELMPHIRMNARRDEVDDERWVNSMNSRYKSSGGYWVESDVSQCDKSQSMYNLALFFYILEQFGAPAELTAMWKVMAGCKRVEAKDVGMLIEYVHQNISGSWLTIAVNTYICATGNIVSMRLTREQVISGEVRGDDCLWRLKECPNLTESSENFSNMFNMEVKVFEVTVPYFCSKYYIQVEDYWFLVRDPMKAMITLGRPLPASVSLEESWNSFADRMKHYDKSEVLDNLDRAYLVRNKATGSIRHGLRALYSLALSFEEYVKVYESEVVVIG